MSRIFSRLRSARPRPVGETATGPNGTPRPGRILWAGASHLGNVRPRNEDAALYLSIHGAETARLPDSGALDLGASAFLCAVSDGMGGARKGETASRMAVECLEELATSPDFAAAARQREFTDVFEIVHERINSTAESRPDCRGMGTTLSLCLFTPRSTFIAHIGDSRVYRLREGRLRQLTHDHTRVGHLYRNRILTERQAREHPRRHVLLQALGASLPGIEPQVESVSSRPGDWFILCSDGLVEGLWNRDIQDILLESDEDESAAAVTATRDRLMAEALARGGRDNITVIVARITT